MTLPLSPVPCYAHRVSLSRFLPVPSVDPAILLQRIRLVLGVILVWVVGFAVSDVFLVPEHLPRLWLLKGVLVIVYVGLLAILRRDPAPHHAVIIGLVALFAGVGTGAGSGMIVGESVPTQMLCMAGLATTALTVPWGTTAQAVAVLISVGWMSANAAAVDGFGSEFVAAASVGVASILAAHLVHAAQATEYALRLELQQSERFLRKITDALPALVAYLDSDQRYRFVNQANLRWLRRDRDAIIGKRLPEVIDAADHALLAPHLGAALAGERRTFEFEAESPAGEPRILGAVLEPDADASGRTLGVVCLLSDITEHKRAAEAARLQQAELAHALRVNTMGEMTAALAHELNQPLAAIAAWAGACVAWSEAGPAGTTEMRKAANFVADEALRAGEIIRRLERLVRKAAPRFEPAAAADVVDHAVALVRSEARSAGVRVVTELADDLPVIRCDAVQIEQVLINLLLNAIQAHERAATPAPTIHVTAEPAAAGGLRVVVRDNGPGVPPDLRRTLFEPWVTTRPEGLGMGLAISRTIVAHHQGALRLGETAPGEAGAAFVLELPADAGALPPEVRGAPRVA